MPPRFTPHQLAFLSAILDDPADDAPRLIYADWLDDNGQPEYAEFIRLQCQSARRFGILTEYEYTGREYDLYNKLVFMLRNSQMSSVGKINGFLHFKGFHRGLPMVISSVKDYFHHTQDQRFPLAPVAPDYQLMVLMDFDRDYRGDCVSLFDHHLFRRAQRVYLRAFTRGRGGIVVAPLPESVVAAAVETFRTRKLLCVRFGLVSEASASLIKARLSPHLLTISAVYS